MQYQYISRNLEKKVAESLQAFPAVAILGPRQSGKSTLAKAIMEKRADHIYLDLERPSDLQKLAEPELFFDLHKGKLICLDEIHRCPEIFPILRSVIDERRRKGQFLILGSASPSLIRQSSETLAGRIAYLELTPFLLSEVEKSAKGFETHWLRGGFPDSYLARLDKESHQWRQNFIQTFLERDIPQLGIRIPSRTLERLWKMCAHHHGQLLNQSRLGESLGVSHTTIRSYLDLLSETFMLRFLPPLLPNLRKRLIKSPRIYLRDSGILHSLLGIENHDDLLGHPVRGASWEGWVIENILGELSGWHGYFYRTATGMELDLVLEKGRKRIAVECKLSPAPEVGQGFWGALSDLEINEGWVIAPVKESYPIKRGVMVTALHDFVESHRNS
ncbi:MAG: ATP-binding protein [Deltaproteobacteria bacterium]|nr:ATP-binding protein [Deltaproteobacteria bacterium]